MNQAVATVKFIRTSPRKIRLVADAVRGMDVEKALISLKFVKKRATIPLSKALTQALANAKQLGLSAPLKISYLGVDKGAIYKRWRAVSRGQGHGLHKYTSHIKVILVSLKTSGELARKKVNSIKTTKVSKKNEKNDLRVEKGRSEVEKSNIKKTVLTKTGKVSRKKDSVNKPTVRMNRMANK